MHARRTLTYFALLLAAVVGLVTLLRANDAATRRVVVPPAAVDVGEPAGDADVGHVVLAGGCFWCVEYALEAVRGVTDVTSGYAGDDPRTATYPLVSAGRTAHAEAVRVTYDPRQVAFADVLRAFFATHDPTQKDRQGPDVGRQYRSAVFYDSGAQRDAARAYLGQLRESGVFAGEVVTTLEPLAPHGFVEAEAYHQDYVADNPDDPYVRRFALPKRPTLRAALPDLYVGD